MTSADYDPVRVRCSITLADLGLVCLTNSFWCCHILLLLCVQEAAGRLGVSVERFSKEITALLDRRGAPPWHMHTYLGSMA